MLAGLSFITCMGARSALKFCVSNVNVGKRKSGIVGWNSAEEVEFEVALRARG